MPIRSAVQLAALLLLAVPAAACYESTQPVGPMAASTIDSAFVGTWTCVDPKDAANRATLISRRLNAHQYEVEWREPGDHVTRYHVHAITAQGLVHDGCRLRVLTGQEMGVRFKERHLGTESLKRLCQFTANGTATNDP